ncbi:MAG: hypothetical protein IJW59_01600 [Clostridia bacterium]|nr:hypothetical protein [Clostridia bacterium]
MMKKLVERKNNNTNIRTRLGILGVQVLTIALLFFVFLKQELVSVVKDIIQSLPVGSNFVESVAVRCYMVLTALTQSPSLLTLFWLILNVFVVYQTIRVVAIFFVKILDILMSVLKNIIRRITIFVQNMKGSYLIHQRLLN